MLKRSLVVVACLVPVLAAPASAGSPATFFLSANGRIGCQLSSGGALGTIAYCQTTNPASSVKLHSNGFAKICKGARCLGNPPENVTKLKAGKSQKRGPFFCIAESSSKIQCYVVKSGKGFEVSSTGIKKVTVRES